LIEENNNDFRMYPNGDTAFKEFMPGNFIYVIPRFSFDKRKKIKLGTVRFIEDED